MGEGEPLGLESGTVRLLDHDPRWAGLFEIASAELRAALGPAVLQVHHVGSTAVPGIAAKPILDILASVPDFERALDSTPVLAGLGYEYRANDEITDRHFFRRRVGTARTHHLSLAEPSSRYSVVTLAFRDVLRTDRPLAETYSELKLELARRFPRDREAYTSGKTRFVSDVLSRKGLVYRDLT